MQRRLASLISFKDTSVDWIPLLRSLCIVLLLAFSDICSAEDATLPEADISSLGRGAEWLSISDAFSMLLDKTGALTIDDIVSGKIPPSRFRPVSGAPSAGYTTNVMWLKVAVKSEGSWPENMTLILQPLFLQALDVYVPITQNPAGRDDFKVFRRGTHRIGEQAGDWHIFYNLPLTLPRSKDVTLYFKVRSESSMMLNASIATTAGLLDYSTTWTAFSAGLVVLSFMSLLISLFLWLQSRRRFFLSFSFLMFCNGFLVACHSGYLPKASGATIDLYYTIASLLITLGNMVFVYDQIFPRHAPAWLRSVFRVLIAFNLLAFTDLPQDIIPYTLVITPLLLGSMASILVLLFCNLTIYRNTRRPDSLTALLASAVQSLIGVSGVISLLGGPDFLGLGERNYWVTMGPFTLLMVLSVIIRASHLQERRKIAESMRLAHRAERRANVLATERTKALRQAKEAAEQSLQKEQEVHAQQTRFVDIIRHQYQTPLTIIRNSTATLLQTLPPAETRNRERLQRINAATVDLNEFLQVSLTRSRMEETSGGGNFEPLSLRDLLVSTVERCRTFHSRHQIDLSFASDLEDVVVCWDKRLVAVALDNLIGNAAKFSPDGNPIRICACAGLETIIISVTDRGIGIPETEKANVTERYFRGSNTRNVTGTGLGLHIASEVARLHGGSLEIANNKTAGVTVKLTLKTAPV